MSTIGMLAYAMPHCNNNENNINNLNNNNNNNNLKIKTMNQTFYGNDQSEIVDIENRNKCEIIIVRKRPKLLPLGISNNSSVNCVDGNEDSTIIPMLMTDQKLVKRPKLENKTITKIPTKGRSIPQPVAVARRNARERNRVKQVNNGFETLRQHIPNEVAEAFEAAGNGRGASKKLSKVETLKMAVEYIRSLEELLSINRITTDEELNRSSVIINSPPLSESDTHGISFNTSDDHEEHMSMCSEADYTTIDGFPYVRIQGTNAYQLITTTTVYDDEENNPITIIHQNLSDDFSTADNLETPMGNNCGYMQSKPMDIMAPALLNNLCGQTLLPAITHTTTPNTSNDSFKQDYTIVPHSPSTIDDGCDIKNMIIDNMHTNYKGTMTLKHEIQDVCDEDVIFDDATSINENSMFEAMYLWQQQQQQFKMKDSE